MSDERKSPSWTSEALAAVGIPPRLHHCTRETWRGEWPAVRVDVNPVFIHGPVGSGKSHLAVALLREWVDAREVDPLPYTKRHTGERVCPVVFADIQRACERMKPGGDSVADVYVDAEFLVFDDLGAERLTDFTMDRVSLVLRQRYDWMRPTIVTTNLRPSQLNETDPRLASRLLSGVVVKREGKDRRLG